MKEQANKNYFCLIIVMKTTITLIRFVFEDELATTKSILVFDFLIKFPH